ncbi:hypothetical protein IFT43_10400 [Oxalobacteraceae sp. CFBP 13708]|nr:hypothetical protein [Oxalobacteraceae sp. CFBP 13708]
MHRQGIFMVAALGAVLSLCSCVQPPAATEVPPADPALAAAASGAAWPHSLTLVGDGFPASGAPCRRVGESAATIDFLDHTAILVGCPTDGDAMQLGGRLVATVDGITLVSVPLRP